MDFIEQSAQWGPTDPTELATPPAQGLQYHGWYDPWNRRIAINATVGYEYRF